MKYFLYIANWKMNLSYTQERAFVETYKTALINLSKKINTQLIICPSFCSLAELSQLLRKTPIKIGAQDCSVHEPGAHTGEISVRSLVEIGCSYCIVGHSERRALLCETSEQVARKVSMLLSHQIIPIVCIGETEQEHNNKKTTTVLAAQLLPFINYLANQKITNPVIIAYEPVWAIGTEKTPAPEALKDVFSWLRAHLQEAMGKNNKNCYFVYGGSIDEKTAPAIKTIDEIQGLLIGGASIDFQKLKKIVELPK